MSGKVGDNLYRASGVVAAAAGGGGLEWCSSIQSTAFCASAGKGYFVNTCGGAVTVTLPATASAGDTIELKDYKRTWGCNQITINTNSLNFQGSASTDVITYDTTGQAVTIVYADATRGWLPIVDDDTPCKVSYSVQFLVVAGGGGCGFYYAAGGAGGYRTIATKAFSVNPGTTYPITVGGGGAGAASAPPGLGTPGENSVFSTMTSAGGGAGKGDSSNPGDADDGGSGGAMGYTPPYGAAGAGNVPPTTCTPTGAQGFPGGVTTGSGGGGGGGGATQAGQDGKGASTPAPSGYAGGNGGAGGTSTISGTAVERAGGGGGTGIQTGGTATGGGGAGMAYIPATGNPGTVNTGGGAGGGTAINLASGGSGIIIIRRLTACSTSTSGTVTTCGSDTIHTFTGDGTFVA